MLGPNLGLYRNVCSEKSSNAEHAFIMARFQVLCLLLIR